MNKTIHDLTIEEVSQAAKGNADKYIDRVKGIAEQAFIEGVMWAQRQNREGATWAK